MPPPATSTRSTGRCSIAIQEAIIALAEDPRPRGATEVSGEEDLWRVRVGDSRIAYHLDGKRLVVLVVEVGNRRDVHRR